MNQVQEVIIGLADRMAQMVQSGKTHNDAIVTLINQLEANAGIDRKQATALVDLAIEAFATKYENRRVFSDDELRKRLDFLVPNAPANTNPPPAGYQSNFDKL